MMDIQFAHPENIHVAWLCIGIIIFLIQRRWNSHSILSEFISSKNDSALVVRVSTSSRRKQILCVAVLLLSSVIALIRPQSTGDTEQLSNSLSSDIMVVLDISKSMLAEDAPPNRLSRAKSEILEMTEQLKGDRVGLVGFAGRSSVLCPLTTDYGFFTLALEQASPKSITRGGTNLGEALRMAVKSFGNTESSKLIVLVTDGEDHDSYPVEMAKQANELGIPIISIGFGSENGSQIMITDSQTGAKSALQDREGNIVISKLDGELLREIALLTEGAYVPAGTAAIDLESIVGEHIKPILTSEKSTNKIQPKEHYMPLILLSLVMLLLSLFYGQKLELES